MNTLPKTLFAFFWHFIKQQWPWFLLLQFFFFGWALDHTLFPYILEMLIDTITRFDGDRSNVWVALAKPLGLGALLWIGVEIGYRVAGFTSAKVIPRLEAAVRMAMFDYVQRHSHVYFSTKFAGSLANKIADMPRSMAQVLHLCMAFFLPVGLALIISSTFFARIHPIFALILLGWFAVHLAICLCFARQCDRNANVHAEARSTLAGKIVDSFSNHFNVKLFARHRYEQHYLNAYQQDELAKNQRSLFYIEKMKIVLGCASFLGAGVLLNWYMIYSWQQGHLTAGEVVFIFNTAWNVTMMAWFAVLEIPNFLKEIGVCRQALSLIQDNHDIVDDKEATSLVVKRGHIAFENVSFHYIPNHNIFQDKNIEIEAGSKVGLIGFSGSGKTTFAHLILRSFDVEQGRILIDDQDIAMVTLDSLHNQIAMIPQDASLFHRSLLENIRYGRLDATDEEVIEAAKKAHCHDFITALPHKYQTLAGERGVKISGGQRQRIAIARAILKNAPILILDEATSALDSVTERQIQEGLDHLMQSKTSIVIAHRLSTLSGMDRLLVFKDGEIVEDGTHEELILTQGHYAAMWESQAEGFLPDDVEYESQF